MPAAGEVFNVAGTEIPMKNIGRDIVNSAYTFFKKQGAKYLMH